MLCYSDFVLTNMTAGSVQCRCIGMTWSERICGHVLF